MIKRMTIAIDRTVIIDDPVARQLIAYKMNAILKISYNHLHCSVTAIIIVILSELRAKVNRLTEG